jgi:hypothetical protein
LDEQELLRVTVLLIDELGTDGAQLDVHRLSTGAEAARVPAYACSLRSEAAATHERVGRGAAGARAAGERHEVVLPLLPASNVGKRPEYVTG